MSYTSRSTGLVSKLFNIKSGAGNMDRAAFYIELEEGDNGSRAFSLEEVREGVRVCTERMCRNRD